MSKNRLGPITIREASKSFLGWDGKKVTLITHFNTEKCKVPLIMVHASIDPETDGNKGNLEEL